MNHHKFKKKIKLRKKYKYLLYILLIFLFCLCINKNNKINKSFKKTSKEYVFKNILNIKSLKNISEEDINKSVETFTIKEDKTESPLVYLYNTHDTEKYQEINGLNFKPSIVNATDYLNEKLNNAGISSIHEKRSMASYLAENNLNYSSSYKASRFYLSDATSNNPSIKYLFDIHRDSGKKEYTTYCSENKCYAKFLFLIGLENENYQDNENFALILSKKLNEKVPGISKGILQKKGPKVNGVYNEDFSNRTLLIEVGGENNTIEEVYNSLDVLSEVLISFIKEEIKNGR